MATKPERLERARGQRGRRAWLELEDGSSFAGWSFGAARVADGEVVFTTGMVGYSQSLTDPSYHGQILVTTWPLAGNYGVPMPSRDGEGLPRYFESERIHASGLVVSELCRTPSHHSSARSLEAWLDEEGVPGIEGIDTRALTMRLRENGTMRGRIRIDGKAELEPIDTKPSVAAVSRREALHLPSRLGSARLGGADFAGAGLKGAGLGVARLGGARAAHVALLDCGAKLNIVRLLLEAGAEVSILPWDARVDLANYDGLFLSNGPGDPKACTPTIATVRRAIAASKPVFGICLGAQLLALAAGADTYKLKYGHRGQNQPCVEAGSGRCQVTSQNHGYAVREESLPPGWEVWFSNANDGSVEGIRSTTGPFAAVQFHPEGCPGPRDTEYLVADYVASLVGGATA